MKLLSRALCICACGLAAWFVSIETACSPQRPALTWRIAPPPFTIEELIHAASRKHQVRAAFVKSIIAAESGFRAAAVSPKGAVGLMQLMPATAREFGADPTIPEQNVDAGTNYLGWLLHRYEKRRDQLSRAIAAYNAGPGSVERFHGIPPYRETRQYVARVLKFMKRYKSEDLAD